MLRSTIIASAIPTRAHTPQADMCGLAITIT